MKGGVGVRDWSVTKLVPKVPERFKHLLPTVLTPERCEFIIDGCSNAVANAIRRTVLCELKVTYLTCEYEDIVTDDPHVIPEMIQKRIREIPLLQSVPPDTVFNLEYQNKTLLTDDVKTGLLVPKGRNNTMYFNETTTLVSIAPGRSIKISNCRIASDFSYKDGLGMCAVAFNATSICLDQTPIDMYADMKKTLRIISEAVELNENGVPTVPTVPTIPNVPTAKSKKAPESTAPVGISTHIADPRVWKIAFNTNGTLSSKEIVKRTCSNIIDRLKHVLSLLHTIVSNDNQYVLTIHGESHTIGNLLMKTTDELYSDVEAVTYNCPNVERTAVIRIIYADDINTLYKNVIDHLVGTFDSIRSAIV